MTVVRAPLVDRQPAAGRRFEWRLLAVPLLIYCASRVVQLGLIAWLLPDTGDVRVRDRLLAWDTGHFLKLVNEGYPAGYTYTDGGDLTGNGLAFFPGYPMLARGLHWLGMDGATALLTVSWLAGVAAVLLVYALGARLYDHRVGVALAALFCTQPMSVVLSMAYSEGLFVALVAGMMLAAHRTAWLTAGALGLGAALTRPTGAAAAVALAVAAAMVVLKKPAVAAPAVLNEPAVAAPAVLNGPAVAAPAVLKGPAVAAPAVLNGPAVAAPAVHRGQPRAWRAIAAAGVALAGVPAYLIWVAQRAGDPDAWFRVQTAGWGTTFDFGESALTFVRDALRGDGWVEVSVAWILIAAVVAMVIALTRRVWPPLLVYGGIALILVIGQTGYYHSKPRLLVPVLVVLVPAAVVLGRARTSTMVTVLVGWAAFGLWYGAYLVTIWRYAI
jgi:hypothetical protein